MSQKNPTSDFLPLRTYNVVPLDSERGLIEWCTGTQSLGEYLTGPDKQTGAHLKYRKPNGMAIIEARAQIYSMHKKNTVELYLNNFLNICERISPVFRHFFYEKFRNPELFYKRIQNYTKSLAQWSIGKLIFNFNCFSLLCGWIRRSTFNEYFN